MGISLDIRVWCAVPVALFHLSDPSNLHAQQKDVLTVTEPLKEYYADTAKISGQIVASVHVNGHDHDTKPYLLAYIPREWAGKDTCLNLVSDSGMYEAEASYRVSTNWLGGYADVSLQSSKHKGFLSRETDRARFATRLSVGACGNIEREFAVTYWNQTPPENGADFEVFINSFRADETYIVVNGQEISCSHFDSGNRISYDFKCLIPINASSGAEKYNIEINRLRDGDFDPPEIIDVFLPMQSP